MPCAHFLGDRMPIGVFCKVVSHRAGAQTGCGRPAPTDGGPALGYPVPGDAPSPSWGLARPPWL